MITGGDNAPVDDEDGFLLLRAYGQPAGEDCLRVNVWTPEINGSAKRPVMVWLHGGGFFGGSGHDLVAYDGENLCHRGDVVVITLNHRLNVLGCLNLAEVGDERYAASGNVGMLDLVAALEWVRDNIDRYETYSGGVLEARALAAQISQAWINFAGCGDPNHSALPHWPAYGADRGQTMIFDNPCSVQDDPDREARRELMACSQ